MTSTGRAAAAWYPDPAGRHQHRYWDGERWTLHVADNGMAGIDVALQQPVVHQPVVEELRPTTTTWQAVPDERPAVTTHWPTTPSPSTGWQAAAGTPAPTRSPAKRAWLFALGLLVAIAGVGATAVLALGRNEESPISATSGGRYPAAIETNFMTGCTGTGGTVNYCRCALTHIEADHDVDDVMGMEQEYRSTGKLPDSIVDAARDCISEQVKQ